MNGLRDVISLVVGFLESYSFTIQSRGSKLYLLIFESSSLWACGSSYGKRL